MVSPQNFMPRKRKQRSAASCLSPNPLTGRSTRSKTQSLLHRSRSGLAWPERNPFPQQPHLQISNLHENPRKTQQMLDGMEASPYVSVEKKCSGRGRTQLRVSTILLSNGVVREKESDGFKTQQDFGGKECPSSGLENDVHLDPRFESLNSGLSESGKEQIKNNMDSVPVSKDSDIGGLVVGCGEQLDKEERSINEKNSFCLVKRNASKSVNRLGKVFKAPASFNYRRLLPFLTEMAKNDSSTLCSNPQTVEILESSLPLALGYAKVNSDCDMQPDEINSKNSGSQQVLDMEDPLNSSARTGGLENLDSDMQLECKNSHSGFQHAVVEHDLEDPSNSSAQTRGQENSDGDLQLDVQNSQYYGFQLPIEGHDSEEPSNNSARTGAQNEVCTTVQANNPSNEIHNPTEECVQTTPPDPAILSKFDIGDRRILGKRNTPYTEIQLIDLKPPNMSSKEYVCDTMNSQPSPIQKSNSSPKTKPFLNQCSRMKIFKTSSISYRRLLPYLMDVAKGASNNDQPPMLENDFLRSSESLSSPSYGDDLSVNRKEQNDLHDKLHVEKEVSNACLIADDASFAEIDTGNLDPLASSDNSSTEETIATSEATTVEPDMHIYVQLDLTVNEESDTAKTDVQVPSLPETVTQHKKRTMKSSQVNCSKDTSISSAKTELQPAEPISDVLLQIQPENGCHLTELATLNNSPVPENSIQNHSPLKGILKRNPRGCRGLCNCLKCSSFRLHAERSFEFSRHQLLDAEEVAFGLIDELTTLRSLLEKNADNVCDVAAFKCDQVKEVCRKALVKEQVAKQRLTLMNEELNVHCRHTPLLRPNVTFSERVEERAISKTSKFKTT